MSQCQKCGTSAPNGAAFCPRCGAPMAVTPPPYNRPYNQAYNQPPCNPPYYQSQYTSQYRQQPYNPDQKSKVAAGLFAIFLGGFGVQYFYCGKTIAGILAIILSFVTCGIFNILFFIQGIVMLTMSDYEFQRKFVYTQSSFPLF